MKALEIKGLEKSFGDKKILNNISLSIESGEIFGLVGKNGAGKTTLMKCILGLINSYNGEIKLFESKSLNEMRALTGSIIEEPAFFPYLTGFQNLKYFAKTMNLKNENEKINNILRELDLYEARNKKFSKYSMGMKQRLGLCYTLLNDPKLLILDEPINGIDPEGIVEIRKLLISLCRNKNITIMISSHILSELDTISDKICIIDEGKIIEVIDKKIIDKANNTLIRSNDDKKVSDILESAGIENSMSDSGVIISEELTVSKIMKFFANEDIEIIDIIRLTESLEEHYLNLVGGRK